MLILDTPTQDIKIMTPKYIFSSTPVCEETRESLEPRLLHGVWNVL